MDQSRDDPRHQTQLELVAEITAAYVSRNNISPRDVPSLIETVFASLVGLTEKPAAPPVIYEPAVPIRKSITPDFLICLEDGKKFRSLKRHLMASFGLTPQQYREKWGLPVDYPMVAPNYSATRSALAIAAGLGSQARPHKARKGHRTRTVA